VTKLKGILGLYDLDAEFKGSKNITLFAHSSSNSTHNTGTDNLTLLVYYSKHNTTYPKGVLYFEISPLSNNQSNVSIYGQVIRFCNTTSSSYCVKTSTPIFNNTNYAYDLAYDLYVRVNVSYSKSMSNWSVDLGVNRTTPVQANTTFLLIKSNLALNTSVPIFAFVDLYNISDGEIDNLSTMDWEWAGYCVNCVR